MLPLEPIPHIPENFFLYNSPDGTVRIEAHLKNDTLWLTLNEIAALFGIDKSGVSRHLKNIYEQGELEKDSTVAKFATVAPNGKQYQVEYYNLDAVISVGYRVNSIRGTQFRIWATQRLREYIIKGFAIDDERIKNNGGNRYFEELLAQIRDIRSSEKLFYQKVLAIYATSIDYDPHTPQSQTFFKTVQNKLHWGAHGHTASQIVHRRADAAQPNMGLTNWPGARITKQDVGTAKNYLKQDELNALNRLVTAFLEFAEIQAINQIPMTMDDWGTKLDQFIELTGGEVLTGAGPVAHQSAIRKAHREYDKFKRQQKELPSAGETDYARSVLELKRLEKRIRKK